MSSTVEEDVFRIKKRLEKMMKANEVDVQITKDMLTSLKKLSIDLSILKTTGIGVVLNNLRKSCNSEELGTLAKGLLKTWKKLVDSEAATSSSQQQQQQQVHSPNSNSNDSSSTKPPVSPSPPSSQTSQLAGKQDGTNNSNGNSTTPNSVQNGDKKDSSSSGGVKRSISESPALNGGSSSSSENFRKMHRSSSSTDTKDPVRLKCREMIANALELPPGSGENSPGGSSSILNEPLYDPADLAARCEEAIFQEFKNTDVKYKNRVRSRVINLKDSRNPKLRESVRLGYITAEKLANMTPDEMASEEMKKLREKLTKEAINDHQMARTQGAKTSLLKCGKCKRNNIEYTEMQTRSADEPMTTFAFCQDCGHRWKFC